MRLSKNIHWLIFGIILVLVYSGGQALITKYIPAAPYPASFTASADVYYTPETDAKINEDNARIKAFNEAKQKAVNIANLSDKRLGKLTNISEYVDNPQASALPDPNATISALPNSAKVSISLTYELE